MFALRFGQLQLLLQHQLLALHRVKTFLCRACRLFRLRQMLRLGTCMTVAQLHPDGGFLLLLLPVQQQGLNALQLVALLFHLQFICGDLLGQASMLILQVRDMLFQAGDFRVAGIKFALFAVYFV